MMLCFDGGGSKSRMLLVDEDFNLIGESAWRGVNTTHTPLSEVQENLRNCLNTVLKGVAFGPKDEAVITFVGPREELIVLLEKTGCKINTLSEHEGALWAGIIREHGFVALAGTGAFVSYSGPDRPDPIYLDGRGLLLGDDGSGAWIGQCALRAVCDNMDGTGSETVLTKRAINMLKVQGVSDIIKKLYSAPSYARFMADFVPEVAHAAAEGDEVALSIFRKAGRIHGKKLLALAEKMDVTKDICVVSGGAWKAHPDMYKAFCDVVQETLPNIRIKKPYFEPILAGLVQKLAIKRPTWSKEECVAFFAERFTNYCI